MTLDGPGRRRCLVFVGSCVGRATFSGDYSLGFESRARVSQLLTLLVRTLKGF